MKKIFKKATVFIFSLVLMIPALVSAASSAFDNLQKVGGEGENAPWTTIVAGSANSLPGIVGIVIQGFLAILGLLFLTYMLYAGYHWMTAQGDEEKVTKAKDTIQRAIIGLIVTIGAYAITYFVMQRLVFGGTIIK